MSTARLRSPASRRGLVQRESASSRACDSTLAEQRPALRDGPDDAPTDCAVRRVSRSGYASRASEAGPALSATSNRTDCLGTVGRDSELSARCTPFRTARRPAPCHRSCATSAAHQTPFAPAYASFRSTRRNIGDTPGMMLAALARLRVSSVEVEQTRRPREMIFAAFVRLARGKVLTMIFNVRRCCRRFRSCMVMRMRKSITPSQSRAAFATSRRRLRLALRVNLISDCRNACSPSIVWMDRDCCVVGPAISAFGISAFSFCLSNPSALWVVLFSFIANESGTWGVTTAVTCLKFLKKLIHRCSQPIR